MCDPCFRRQEAETSSREIAMPEQAVIVEFQYGSTDLEPLFELEDKLAAAIEGKGVGEYDGNEIAVDGSDGSLYMYGPDAAHLAEIVRPVLEGCPFMKGARIRIRRGAAGTDAPEDVIQL
jgi:hypothetical protein